MLARFGISRLLSFTVLIALFCALPSYEVTDDERWTEQPLSYSMPIVPASFSGPDRPRPNSMNRWSSVKGSFENGEQLYVASYRRGWEKCRGRFATGDRWRQTPSVYSVGDAFDQLDEWSIDHCSFAAGEGYKQCVYQIDQLLINQTPNELVDQLLVSIWWHALPHWIIMVLILFFMFYTLGSFTSPE